MPDSAVIPATTTFRMTSLAWAVAVQSATETLGGGAGPDLAGSGSAPAPAAGGSGGTWRGWTTRPGPPSPAS